MLTRARGRGLTRWRGRVSLGVVRRRGKLCRIHILASNEFSQIPVGLGWVGWGWSEVAPGNPLV